MAAVAAAGTGDTVTLTSGSNVSLTTQQDQSNGIVAQSIGGSGGNGGFAGAGSIGSVAAGVSLGGDGATGGASNAVTITSAAAIQTSGVMSSGIVAQSLAGNGGNGGSRFWWRYLC